MKLEPARVGPYLRALSAALHALAPHQDWPPMQSVLDHFRALQPSLCGDLLSPADVDSTSGMPAFAWMERASAEAAFAREGAVLKTDAQIERAHHLDGALGRRLEARRDLHAFLRGAPILGMSTAVARARRLRNATEVLVELDAVLPDGRLRRTRLVLAAPDGSMDLGCARVHADGSIKLDPGLAHVVTRHDRSPLIALLAQVRQATQGRVCRVSRGFIGPFWFDGVALPPGVPEPVGQGLCLNLLHEAVGDDIVNGVLRDPLLDARPLRDPEGLQLVQDRRFACTPPVQRALRDWCNARGVEPDITLIRMA
ncbi:MAG: hypothetical protein AB8H79_01580 [Myxococcota bacterium]